MGWIRNHDRSPIPLRKAHRPLRHHTIQIMIAHRLQSIFARCLHVSSHTYGERLCFSSKLQPGATVAEQSVKVAASLGAATVSGSTKDLLVASVNSLQLVLKIVRAQVNICLVVSCMDHMW